MKKLYILFGIIVIIMIIGFATYKQEKSYSVNAKVEIPIMEYDFGEITYLDTINYAFKIKNVGKEPLIINKVIPNCTCTLLSYESGIILPNNETEIFAQFIPNKTRLGENSVSILVEGNFNGGVTHLKMKGIVNNIPKVKTATNTMYN